MSNLGESPAAARPGQPALDPISGTQSSQVSLPRLLGSLALGNFVSMGLRLAGALLQTQVVPPSILGIFTSIGLVMGYMPLLHFGVLDGLGRELPVSLGEGGGKNSEDLAAAAQAWSLAMGAIIAVVLLLVSAWFLSGGQIMLAFGWISNALIALTFLYAAYLQIVYRSYHSFRKPMLIGCAVNAISLALVMLAVLWSFYGLCIRAVITSAMSVALLHYFRPARFPTRLDWNRLKNLMRVGLPILGGNYLQSFWGVLNITLLLRLMGTEAVGLYALVQIAVTCFDLLPLTGEQVVYPRMAEQFGRFGKVDLVGIWLKPAALCLLGALPLALIGWWAAEPIVVRLAPEYVAAVPAVRWSILAPLVGIFMPLGSFFNVVQRQDLLVASILIGMATYLILLYLLAGSEPSLVAFPQAMFGGRLVQTLVGIMLMRFVRSR